MGREAVESREVVRVGHGSCSGEWVVRVAVEAVFDSGAEAQL